MMNDMFDRIRTGGYGLDIPDHARADVEALAARAERRLHQRVPSLTRRLHEGTTDEDTVADVVTDMVLRVIRNPEGLTTETAEGFSYRTDWAAASGRLHVTREDITHLGIRPHPHIGTIHTTPPAWRLP